MGIHVGLSKQFWADAVNTAIYLIKKGLSVPLGGGLPEEAWTGTEVNLTHLKIFGCIPFMFTLTMWINSVDGTKLDAKSLKCTCIGYGVDDFGYWFWDAKNRKIIRSNDEIFNETVMYKDMMKLIINREG